MRDCFADFQSRATINYNSRFRKDYMCTALQSLTGKCTDSLSLPLYSHVCRLLNVKGIRRHGHRSRLVAMAATSIDVVKMVVSDDSRQR